MASEPNLEAVWRERGLSARAIAALVSAGCTNTDDIRRRGKRYFDDAPNCGSKTVREIGALIGGWDAAGLPLAVRLIAEGMAEAVTDRISRQYIANAIVDRLSNAGFRIVARFGR